MATTKTVTVEPDDAAKLRKLAAWFLEHEMSWHPEFQEVHDDLMRLADQIEH